jgi:hypothetical protein
LFFVFFFCWFLFLFLLDLWFENFLFRSSMNRSMKILIAVGLYLKRKNTMVSRFYTITARFDFPYLLLEVVWLLIYC